MQSAQHATDIDLLDEITSTLRGPMAIWRCPVLDCSDGPFGARWQFTETAATVEALVIAYAREHHGEMPEPAALAGLRRDRAVALLDEHLCLHPREQIETWLDKIF